jgi:hypothetical protein
LPGANTAAARRRANEVIDELGLKGYPIDPATIASARRIAVENYDVFPRGCYGALVREGDRFRIMVSAACPTPGHRRFTISHELGHYHIDGHVEALLSTSRVAYSLGSDYRGGKDPREVEADAFASELLMPRRFAAPTVSKLRPGLQAVRDISSGFDVSLSAAAVRLADLSPEPLVVILSSGRVIEWASFSGAFAPFWWARRKAKGSWAPPRSATLSLASAPERVLAGHEETGCSLLDEWFDEAPAVEVEEEALGLGTFRRVLTILYCPELPDPEEADSDE